ncbi:MAG: Mor transcription activator family protein [Methylobacter sp.]
MSDYLDQLYNDLLMTANQFGMSHVTAQDFARSMVDRIKNAHAGPVYIPKPDKSRRNERIRRTFNGVNHDIVCREFGISKATLYRVVGQAKPDKPSS